MKFDFIIGNPPYQDESQRNNGYASPIYNLFLEDSYKLARNVILIHPARFLFNAGSTPKAWNEKMLNDPHLKVVYYNKDSSEVFTNADIKGGVAVTYRDSERELGPIDTFTAYEELNGILSKVKRVIISSLSDICYVTPKFDYDGLITDHPECSSLLKERRLATNVFDILSGIVFFSEKPNDGNDYIRVYGRRNNIREYMWIKKAYIEIPDNLSSYKLFLPKVNGNGTFGETITDPVVGAINDINTHTFMSIGSFANQEEALAALKYIKTKFARAMLGVLKITQHNSNECWRYVPLQDFTLKSDIDWSQSISDIDVQLYKKYGLDDKEIEFIESHVKEME